MPINKRLLIGLILLPAFFLLHNYNEMPGFIGRHEILLDAAIIYGTQLLFYFLIRLRGISNDENLLILICISLFVLFFGPINLLVSQYKFSHFLSSYYIFFPVFCLILFFIIRKIIKAKEIKSTVSTPFFVIIAMLFSIEIVTLLINKDRIKKNHNLIYPGKPLSENYKSSSMADSSKPDIFFFVFDAYSSNSMLKQVWNFDNSDLMNWLRTRGFYMPANTHSNYNFTAFSVSSTFNMNYLPKEKGNNAGIPINVLQANRSLSDNETFSILEKENYTIHFLAPFSNRFQDNGLGKFFDYLADKQIERQTLPGCLYDSKIKNFIASKFIRDKEEAYYKPFKDKLQNLRSTAEKVKACTDSSSNRKPQFVYGHFMIPHEPPLFDTAGKFISPEEALSATPYNTYIAQIKYANVLIKEVIEYIRMHNKPNTIIIIEGDHGFGFFSADSIPAFAFRNFSAIYFPDGRKNQLYESMTPINVFRIVFDDYFNQHFPLLTDSSTVVKE